jgi:hypothetical protein
MAASKDSRASASRTVWSASSASGLVLAQRVGDFHDRHAIFAERSFDDIEFGDGNR